MLDPSYDDLPPLAGSLLISHPSLTDDNFHQTVVLMARHDTEDGALGVVLNRSAEKTLGSLSEDFVADGLGEVPLYIGGPVNPNQIILAAWKSCDDGSRLELMFGMEPSVAAEKYREDPELQLRAFRGYAGWTAGQLEGELDANAWLLADLDAELLARKQGVDLWKRLLVEANVELGLAASAPADLSPN